MKKLQLSLKTKWFKMTKYDIKKEDYREITDYWCRRLLDNLEDIEPAVWQEMIEDLNNPNRRFDDVNECLEYYGVAFKTFDYNLMTLGYPKSDDFERILKLENKGVEIRTGNPEWGADPGKLYFVIKHGENLWYHNVIPDSLRNICYFDEHGNLKEYEKGIVPKFASHVKKYELEELEGKPLNEKRIFDKFIIQFQKLL